MIEQLYIKASSTKNINIFNDKDLQNALKNLRDGTFAEVVDSVIRNEDRQALMYYYSTEMFSNEKVYYDFL